MRIGDKIEKKFTSDKKDPLTGKVVVEAPKFELTIVSNHAFVMKMLHSLGGITHLPIGLIDGLIETVEWNFQITYLPEAKEEMLKLFETSLKDLWSGR